MALGFNHVTAQQKRKLGATTDYSIEESVHYRLITNGDYERNGFDIVATAGSNGHFVSSMNVVNVHGNDSVYVRVTNLNSNGFETLHGTKTNVMGVVPMTSGDNTVSFHMPNHPFSTNQGRKTVDELQIELTDADGQLVEFNGVEHELQFLFECYDEGTRPNRPADPGWFEKKKERHSDPFNVFTKPTRSKPPSSSSSSSSSSRQYHSAPLRSTHMSQRASSSAAATRPHSTGAANH